MPNTTQEVSASEKLNDGQMVCRGWSTLSKLATVRVFFNVLGVNA